MLQGVRENGDWESLADVAWSLELGNTARKNIVLIENWKSSWPEMRFLLALTIYKFLLSEVVE